MQTELSIQRNTSGQHNCFQGIAPFLALAILAVVATIWISAFNSGGIVPSDGLHKLRVELSIAAEKLAQVTTKLNEMENCHRIGGSSKDVFKYCAAKAENFRGTNNHYIRQLVKEELEIYDSDKTGLPDFALEALGGCIVSTRDTKPFNSSIALSVFGVPIISYHSNPRALIQPNTEPGACWAFSGSEGTVVIQLITSIFVSHITLQHISAKLYPSGSIDSAPKVFSVRGLSGIEDNEGFYYGTFEYTKGGSTIQSFQVQNRCSTPHRLIEVKFLSNHGNPKYTCIYRVRIHGEISKKSQSPLIE